ncbi:MAG: GNAT family N-acetyltransferase [Sphingomonadaceae bacterium]|nr:GNAT family N-acetyltransferase [Sphingomonadaceae bacterium]
MILGEAICLGPILPIDVEALFRWSDDVATARLNAPYRPPSWQREEAFWLDAADDRTRVFFAIRTLTAPEIVGFVQIRDVDPIHRSCTIGIRIGDVRNRGRGFGREALALAVGYCWDQLNLSRIALQVFANNAAAIRLYRACGFEPEGVLRKAQFVAGEWIDVQLMALMRPSRVGA